MPTSAWRYRHRTYEDYQELLMHLQHTLIKDGLHTLIEPPHNKYNHLELMKHQAQWRSMKTLEGDKAALVYDTTGIQQLTDDLKTSWQDRAYSILCDMTDNATLQMAIFRKANNSKEKFKVAMVHIADKWKHHSKEVRQDQAIDAMEDLKTQGLQRLMSGYVCSAQDSPEIASRSHYLPTRLRHLPCRGMAG